MGKGSLDEQPDRLRLACGQHKIVSMRMLKNPPHPFDVIACMPPVALRIEVAEPKLILKAKMDCRNSTGNFACNEGLASDGTFMIEQDAIRREYTVSFAIVYGDPVGVQLCRSVGRARIKRRALALGNFLNKTIELRRLRLIKTRLVRQT